jgi:hypothetical protein
LSILLATADATLTTFSAIGGIVLGWLLNEFSNRWSAKRLFDHRARLKKEYSLYVNLWDKLFDIRSILGEVIEPLSMLGGPPPKDGDITKCFNAFQAAVRSGEPSMSTSVFTPAREITSLAREIIRNLGKLRALDEREEGVPKIRNDEADEQLADRKIQLDEEIETSFDEIERLYQTVSRAIRERVSVP